MEGGLRRGCPPPGQVTLRSAGLEHLRKGNFCLHGGLGNFSASVYGDGSGAQSLLLFPAPVTQPKHPNAPDRFPWPVTLERASLTGLPAVPEQPGRKTSCFQQQFKKPTRKTKQKNPP